MTPPDLMTPPSDSPEIYHPSFTLDQRLLGRLAVAPRGTALTYGATPLDRVASIAEQIGVRDALQSKIETDIPEEVPTRIVKAMNASFNVRFRDRGEANDENFLTALRYDEIDRLGPFKREMIERARLGFASPTELLYVRDLLGIRSVELACLTHPYGKDYELLDEMRAAVKFAVESFPGGQFYPQAASRFKAKEMIFDEGGAAVGLLMTRKRLIGVVNDTIVRERTSFILRTDADGPLDRHQRQTIMTTDWDDPHWREVLMTDVLELEDIAGHMLDSGQHTMAVPLSTTVYAHHPRTAEQVYRRQDALARERREAFMRSHPEIAQAMAAAVEELEGGRGPLRHIYATDGGMIVNDRTNGDETSR